MAKKKKQRREIAEEDILDALEEKSYPLSLREIAREVGAHGRQRRAVKKILEKSRRIAEVKGSRYMPAARKRAQESKKETPPPPRAARDVVTGRLTAHRDGYGFVIPDEPIPGMQGDIFVPPNAIGEAMHGDHVRVQVRAGRGRRGGGRVEGRIVGVERRAHATVVGKFLRGDRFNYVEPYEQRLRREILIPRGAEHLPGKDGRASTSELDGAIVNVEITHYPTSRGSPARGRVTEVLGRPGDFGLDVEIVIRKYQLPDEFEDEVLAEARRVPPEPAPEERERRRDFRDLPIVTIDGEDAKDFDDAVYVERRPDGRFLLHVHIADVSHYVRPGSVLDREARFRGTSVYFPDRALPMLPVELSNGICSLKPEEDRLVMSCLIEIDPEGNVVRYELAPGVIRSAARMTYTAVNAALEGEPEVRARYSRLLPEFEKMRDLALILNARRERRGSIDFDLPEPLIRFDERGQMVGITRSERNIAHRLIEEFMLAANETVAGHLSRQRVASLYRVHEEPDPQKVVEFEELAATFGYSLGVAEQVIRTLRVGERRRGRDRQRERRLTIPERIDISPRHYQRLTRVIAGRPEERILSYLMLRSLKQARYAEQNVGHFALATPCYTHFTSPIRRYPDLIVHRLLKWALAHGPHSGQPAPGGTPRVSPKKHGEEEEWRGPLQPEELRSIAVESSEAERRADDAERELIDLKKLAFMEQHLGDEFDGLIINVAKFGFWVELLDLFVEGIVPLETLDRGADYYFREATRSITPGRRSQVPDAPAFRLGDRVRVRVDRIDSRTRKIQFSVVSPDDGG